MYPKGLVDRVTLALLFDVELTAVVLFSLCVLPNVFLVVTIKAIIQAVVVNLVILSNLSGTLLILR